MENGVVLCRITVSFIFLMQNNLKQGLSVGYLFSQFRRVSS